MPTTLKVWPSTSVLSAPAHLKTHGGGGGRGRQGKVGRGREGERGVPTYELLLGVHNEGKCILIGGAG